MIKVKHIIAGPEYRDSICELLGVNNEKNTRESLKLLRVTLICKKSEEQLKG
jgi:hypothetical protein